MHSPSLLPWSQWGRSRLSVFIDSLHQHCRESQFKLRSVRFISEGMDRLDRCDWAQNEQPLFAPIVTNVIIAGLAHECCSSGLDHRKNTLCNQLYKSCQNFTNYALQVTLTKTSYIEVQLISRVWALHYLHDLSSNTIQIYRELSRLSSRSWLNRPDLFASLSGVELWSMWRLHWPGDHFMVNMLARHYYFRFCSAGGQTGQVSSYRGPKMFLISSWATLTYPLNSQQ